MLFRNIAETLPINARRRPDHPAIICGERTIDYAGLARQVGQTAGMLAEMGVSRGDIVGVALKDSPEHLIAMLAIAHLGAVILPMDCRWAPPEKNNLADWFAPLLILVDAGCGGWCFRGAGGFVVGCGGDDDEERVGFEQGRSGADR